MVLIFTFILLFCSNIHLYPSVWDSGKPRAAWNQIQDGRCDEVQPTIINLYFYLYGCLFVSNKRQNGRTVRAQILCGISQDPREGLWMNKVSKISLQQNSIVIKFWKSANYLFVLVLQMYTKRKCSQLKLKMKPSVIKLDSSTKNHRCNKTR